ncbi:hypothetical protein C9J12_11530 [Photobacterium frigidiphilum]|uniref:Lipoprotein n=1 Tax=Photobacterium frigidiphilum TaxID=264736 RepID=A0A2T3JII6_9GAMM|nr:type II secretion system pilot lipoprotein GspS-beta [Photobacterium frigidiphilum]PSU48674.1 hypothetical protein C9J12_11530 [Photobacterium frigidiphilum]
MLKKILALSTLLILGGCASTEDDAVIALAKSRATTINNKAPYDKVDQYQIMRAQARNKIVEITILYGGGSKIAPSQAAAHAAKSYCSSNELSPLFNEGMGYNIIIMDMRGRKIVEQPVYAEYCAELSQ